MDTVDVTPKPHADAHGAVHEVSFDPASTHRK
jgi:hypothetical protein